MGTELLAWLLIALAGAAIGATAIGGVLVVPVLTTLLGVPLPTAIAVSSLAFFVTGAFALSGTGALARVRHEGPLLAAALVGAATGATLTAWLPADAMRAWIGLLALVSGVHAVLRLRQATPTAERPWPGAPAQVALGLAVGVGSALSGTGGPVMLLPLLMLMQRPVARAIVAAQIIQLPIALALSMPVFITPPPARREVACELVKGEAGAPAVSCANTGTAYAQMREVRLQRNDQTLARFEGGSYLLPGARRTVVPKPEGPGLTGTEPLTVEVQFDDGQTSRFTARLP